MPGISLGHQDEEAGLFLPQDSSYKQEGKTDIYKYILISIILKMQQYLKIDSRTESRIRNSVGHNPGRNMRACAQARAGLKSLYGYSLLSKSISVSFLCTFHISVHFLLILQAKPRSSLNSRLIQCSSFVLPYISMPFPCT